MADGHRSTSDHIPPLGARVSAAPGRVLLLSKHRRGGDGMKVRLSLLAIIGTAGLVGMFASPAAAHTGTSDPFGSGSLVTQIGAGNKGVDVGQAWFKRVTDPDG